MRAILTIRSKRTMKKNSRQDIELELVAITRQLLSENGEPYTREIKMDASLQRHLGIDSLGRAELFQRISKTFEVNIPDRLLMEAETLNDIATFLINADPQIQHSASPKTITTHKDNIIVDMGSAKTLLDILWLYGEQAPDKAHIYFQHEDGHEEVITYGQLLKASLQVAHGLRALGLEEGETVAIMQPTQPGFFYTFMGTLLAGGVPVPIYPPFRMHMLEVYAKTEARILSNAEVRVLVTFEQAEKLSYLLKSFVPSLKHVTTVTQLLQPQTLDAPFKATPDNYAFIQYTSGSTSDPKGVLLTHANLLANIHAYGDAIQVTPDDVAVSWLPLYHDMGLIGMWLGSLYYGVPLILLTPFTFLNHPEKWLWAIHYHRGTLSGAPNFAYDLCVRKIDPAALEGLDLSSWRMAANGAEKVYAKTLDQFVKKFSPYGFKRRTFCPVYGLAESTVALAIPPRDKDYLVDYVDRKQFEEDRKAVPVKEEKNSLAFVGCGEPMTGHSIRIVDEENNPLGDRRVGNLQFQGPSSMQGYYHNARATQAIFHDGWWDSGDLAYLADGQVFITGRRKDLIIKAGRNLYPAEIEELVGAVPGVRQGCVVAFDVNDNERATEQLIVVAETREKKKAEREHIREQINETISATLDIVPDRIVLVAPHTVPKTSSGKLQRAACKKMYLENRLGKIHVPPWMQIVRLGLESGLRKSAGLFSLASKFLYTLYMGLIIAITILPIYVVVLFASREFAAKVCQKWARLILKLSLCPVQMVGLEKIPANTPIIFAANHASYVDAVVALAYLPLTTRFVGKKELFSVPVIRTFMQKLGYLAVDRIDLSKGIEDTQHIEETLKNGNPIFIFPEGTFGYSSGLRPFRLGAFKIATQSNVAICPIALQGTRAILRDDEKLMAPGRIVVTICDEVKPEGSEWQHVTHLRNKVRMEIAKYCGEPSLDFIAAQIVAPKKSEIR